MSTPLEREWARVAARVHVNNAEMAERFAAESRARIAQKPYYADELNEHADSHEQYAREQRAKAAAYEEWLREQDADMVRAVRVADEEE